MPSLKLLMPEKKIVSLLLHGLMQLRNKKTKNFRSSKIQTDCKDNTVGDSDASAKYIKVWLDLYIAKKLNVIPACPKTKYYDICRNMVILQPIIQKRFHKVSTD